jgi:hypothetical protein
MVADKITPFGYSITNEVPIMKQTSTTTKVLLLFPVLLCCLAQAQARPKEVKMDKATWRKLSMFLSNFSEARLPSFKRGHLSNAAMIEFGLRHRWINEEKKYYKQNPKYNQNIENPRDPRHYYYRVDAKHIQSAARWYFGCSIKPTSTPNCVYQNGYYYIDFGDGDPLPFSQIYKLVNLGDET